MSATVVSRLPSHVDNPPLDQTNQPPLQLTSLPSFNVPPPPPEPSIDRVQSTPEDIESPAASAEDVMDHEPTLNQDGVSLLPNSDSPTLPQSVHNDYPDQMNIDGDSVDQTYGHLPSQQLPNFVILPEPANMDPAAAPQTHQPTTRPMMVPVRISTTEHQPQHRRNHANPAPSLLQTVSPNQVQVEPPEDGNAHSEDESSVEDGEEDEEGDEIDREFLEGMVEDLSTPTKEALEKMEQSKEFSAVHHSVWESRVYKPLDDPEYQPQIAGRISWRLQGFHGTVDAPNKQRIMRSPPVDIGGFRFNIKVFPRGNEGTDHISVYVECTGRSPPTNEASPISDKCSDFTDGNDAPHAAAADTVTITKWEVPAQIGCIMYNPQEPRVYKFEQANHHFQEDSPDWGWTRFYGPWNALHLRRWDQRRPMLQNDELAFCIYLRTVEDPTRGLWWQPAEGCRWDSFAKTGLRAIDGYGSSRRAVAAALVPWFHLTAFQNLLTKVLIPRSHLELQKRPWPMFEALHRVLQQKHREEASDDVASIAVVEKLLEWYDADLTDSTDVIEIWENLRSILNREFYGDRGNTSYQDDVLSFIKTYRLNYDPQTPTDSASPSPQRQTSVQDIVESLFADGQNTYLEWEGHKSGGKDLPPVMQIELCRQRYDPHERLWKRLTHRIHINETIRVQNTQYRLFGLVISRGKLGSGKTYSIVRSSDIDSQWVAYKSGVVSLLTSKTAIRSHEGDAQSREGDESVAQVLIYIRSTCCAKHLPVRPLFPNMPIMKPFSDLEDPLRKMSEPLATLPVVVHYASAFEGYQGPGVVDPYRPVLGGVSGIELASHFNAESTIESVENYLQATRGSCLQFKCSVLDWESPPAYRPPKPKACSPTQKLGEVCVRSARVHLWARCVSPQLVRKAGAVEDNQETQMDSECMKPKEIFVKVFDRSAQRVTGLLSFIAINDSTLANFIPPNKLPPGPLAIYMEQADGYEVRSTNITLETIVSSVSIPPSCVLVIAHQPQGKDTLVSANDHLHELHDYYLRQRYTRHFAYQGPTHRRSYFGGVHIRSQLRDGLIQGYGTMVETNGDYYSGCFRSGYMHGQGTMYYSNGDTYFGGWSTDKRSGYGTMIYGSTGNTYIGEWLDGRRYGSGTMTFKMADEQQAMCHICYGNEIDALFYRCGHILACESCARQCKDCPVCRKPVDAVVRIYDLRREGV